MSLVLDEGCMAGGSIGLYRKWEPPSSTDKEMPGPEPSNVGFGLGFGARKGTTLEGPDEAKLRHSLSRVQLG